MNDQSGRGCAPGPPEAQAEAAQATTSDAPIWAFVRPKDDFFDGTRLVIATPDGFRPLSDPDSRRPCGTGF